MPSSGTRMTDVDPKHYDYMLKMHNIYRHHGSLVLELFSLIDMYFLEMISIFNFFLEKERVVMN